MIIEVFKYTERVINMIRPRNLLFMAIGRSVTWSMSFTTKSIFIDGVAPRAKMNQQRSRRFRSAQEAKQKEEARKEAVAMWEGRLTLHVSFKILTKLCKRWVKQYLTTRRTKLLGTRMLLLQEHHLWTCLPAR